MKTGVLNPRVNLLSNKTISQKWYFEYQSNVSADDEVLWVLFANGKNRFFHTTYGIKMEGVMSNDVMKWKWKPIKFLLLLNFFFLKRAYLLYIRANITLMSSESTKVCLPGGHYQKAILGLGEKNQQKTPTLGRTSLFHYLIHTKCRSDPACVYRIKWVKGIHWDHKGQEKC